MTEALLPFTADEERWIQKEEGVKGRIYWPGGDSGPTGDVGYDFGYQSRQQITDDWRDVPGHLLRDLLVLAGIKGEAAGALVKSSRIIPIPLGAAMKVFRERTAPRYWAKTLRAFPGVEHMSRGAQLALFSLVYNRGDKVPEFFEPRREEMTAIRHAVLERNNMLVADHLVVMARLWEFGRKDDDGLVGRREREAQLVDPSVVARFDVLRQRRRGAEV